MRAPALRPLSLAEIVRCPVATVGWRNPGAIGLPRLSQHYLITDGIPQLFMPNDWGTASWM